MVLVIYPSSETMPADGVKKQLWKTKTELDIGLRKIAGIKRHYSFSEKIYQDFNNPEKRKKLESIIYNEETAGRNLENISIVDSMIDMSKEEKRIGNVSDLTTKDLNYFKSNYFCIEKEQIKRINLKEEDISYLHEELKPEVKEFMSFYARMMRTCHSLEKRESGQPYEIHTLQTYKNFFQKDFEPFILPENDPFGFKSIDEKISELIKKIDPRELISCDVSSLSYDISKPQDFLIEKPNFEKLIEALMHDYIEELADLAIPNYKQTYKENKKWEDRVISDYQERLMALLYGTMLEAYNFVKNNDKIEHKNFFYRSINSIGYCLSNLTKNRSTNYFDYTIKQILNPEDNIGMLRTPFKIWIDDICDYLPLPKGVEANDLPTLVNDMIIDVFSQRIPEYKKEIDKRNILSVKLKDHRANSMDMEHFSFGKTMGGIIKAKTTIELFLMKYLNSSDRERKGLDSLLWDCMIQTNLNIDFLYAAGIREYISLLKPMKNGLIDEEKLNAFKEIMNTTVKDLIEYIGTDRFTKLTEKIEKSPFDGFHYYYFRMMTDKKFEKKRLTYKKNQLKSIQDFCLLYSTLKFKLDYLIKEKKMVVLKGHGIEELAGKVYNITTQ